VKTGYINGIVEFEQAHELTPNLLYIFEYGTDRDTGRGVARVCKVDKSFKNPNGNEGFFSLREDGVLDNYEFGVLQESVDSREKFMDVKKRLLEGIIGMSKIPSIDVRSGDFI